MRELLLLISVLASVGHTSFLDSSPDRCLNLVNPPVIKVVPEARELVLKEGESVVLECKVTSIPQATAVWILNGVVIKKYDTFSTEEAEINKRQLGLGMTDFNLRIPCAERAKAGEYKCVVRNECGLKAVSSTVLNVVPRKGGRKCKKSRALPPLISAVSSMRVEVTGNAIHLLCRVDDSAQNTVPSQISWTRIHDDESEEPIKNDVRFMKLSTGDLLVVGDNAEHQYAFRCTAANPYGVAQAEAVALYVYED